MTVPGVPGVLVGATQSAAWGLTTGVADTEDIYLSKVKDGKYKIDDTEKPIKIVSVQVPVKGGESKFLARRETEFGPIVYEVPSKFIGFSRKRVYAKRELKSYEAVSGLWNVKSKADFEATVSKATMNFNCFIALKTGDTWVKCHFELLDMIRDSLFPVRLTRFGEASFPLSKCPPYGIPNGDGSLIGITNHLIGGPIWIHQLGAKPLETT
jgi:penicillin amidase